MQMVSAWRRCDTNVLSNLPMVALDGADGTMTPGCEFVRVSVNHKKSEKRRRTENEDFWKSGEVV